MSNPPQLDPETSTLSTEVFAAEAARQLGETGIVAVLTIDDLDAAVPAARALMAGGVRAMELTLRTPVALDALRAIRHEVPEMLAGIGTILTAEQVRDVQEAGASFGVAPGMNPRVIEAARTVGLSFAPGIVTPSDVEAALELGCRTLKFFPAEPSGGLSYLQSMAAPYAHLGVRYLPLGGISLQNLASYLTDPQVLAVGGSWIAARDLIQRQDWGQIEQRAQETRRQIDAIERSAPTE